MDTCENSVSVVTGLENYLSCSVTKKPCAFQRYCMAREEAINTEGYKDCKARGKKINTEPVQDLENTVDDILPLEKVLQEPVEAKKSNTQKLKNFGTVTLVTKTYVVFEYNGSSCYKNGNFDVKIGDKIEI